MPEVPEQQIDQTPLDEERFASICEETGRGIRARILTALDGWYGRTDEELKRLYENSRGKLKRTNAIGVVNIGKTSLTAIEKYLKEKKLI